jgi:hypothetical protein
MKVRQINDIACFFADLDSNGEEDWSLSYENYQKVIAEGKFDAYGNMFDTGYERLAFIFALFHEFEESFVAQSENMDAIDHPNANEIFAFGFYENLRKRALVRMFGDDVDVDRWDFFQ